MFLNERPRCATVVLPISVAIQVSKGCRCLASCEKVLLALAFYAIMVRLAAEYLEGARG